MFIGQDITRVDALDKVLGTAAFAHEPEEEHHALCLRGPQFASPRDDKED